MDSSKFNSHITKLNHLTYFRKEETQMTVQPRCRIMKPARLGKAVTNKFPTVDTEKFFQHLESYRRNRVMRKHDWEGQLSFFQRVINIAFCNRHLPKTK